MRSSYLAAAIAMALPLPAAWAQTPTETATLGEVIVTAQRRSENIQDVPVAVSTLSDEKLDILASGGDDIRFLVGAPAEPEHRIVLRPRLPALLHPRPRQHGLRPQRIAARVARL